jgi:band 7/mec-2 family protein
MSVVIIPQSETRIIERLGKYYATLKPGINIIIPFIDRAKIIMTLNRGRYVYSSTIDLREQVYDFDKQNVITKDNIQMQINALLYFQIVDPFKAVYEINNLPNAIEKLTQTTLRNIIGELELDQTLTSRDTINTKLRAVLDDATNKWGIKVNRVELQDITPPVSVLQAMEKQMQAERNKRATILNSEGEKAAVVLRSEGEKTSMINRAEASKQQAILKAEGEAQARIRKAEAEAIAIKQITEAVGDTSNPANYLLAQKYIAMLQELATGDKTKTVYLPYEATNLLGSIGGIKDLFKSE